MRILDRVRRSPLMVRELASSAAPWQDAWLAARMLGWAIVLPALKHVVPVRVLARLMWKKGHGACRNPAREQRVVRLAGLLSRGTNLSSRGACLQQSLLAYRYLSELGADPRLMLAFRKNGDAVAGHACVMVDGQPIEEFPNQPDDFMPVVAFGEGGNTIAAAD